MTIADTNGSDSVRRRIHLLRHAEVGYFDAAGKPTNPKHVGLTAHGKQQAFAMSEMLADVHIDRAICSGLRRTRETAVLVLGGRDLPVEEQSLFREIRGGRLRDFAPAEFDANLRHPFADAGLMDGCFLGGERFEDIERRVLEGLRVLLGQPGWQQLLLVAHDVVNRLVLAWAMAVPRAVIAALEQDYCCLNVIDVPAYGESGHCLVRTMNYSPGDPVKRLTTLTSLEQAFAAWRPSPG